MNIREHKISYIGFAIVAMWFILGIVSHDQDIYYGIREGKYDVNALGQLYFPSWNLSIIEIIGGVLFYGSIALIGYIIVILIARHQYNNQSPKARPEP